MILNCIVLQINEWEMWADLVKNGGNQIDTSKTAVGGITHHQDTFLNSHLLFLLFCVLIVNIVITFIKILGSTYIRFRPPDIRFLRTELTTKTTETAENKGKATQISCTFAFIPTHNQPK